MATVLIVDDSKLARIVLKKAIGALKPEWEPHEAANGDEALSALRRAHFDVVIVDYNMPGLDGLALAEEVRSFEAKVPIALVTANVQHDVIARARALNVAFVPKPITEDALRGFVSGAELAMRRQNPA